MAWSELRASPPHQKRLARLCDGWKPEPIRPCAQRGYSVRVVQGQCHRCDIVEVLLAQFCMCMCM